MSFKPHFNTNNESQYFNHEVGFMECDCQNVTKNDVSDGAVGINMQAFILKIYFIQALYVLLLLHTKQVAECFSCNLSQFSRSLNTKSVSQNKCINRIAPIRSKKPIFQLFCYLLLRF